MDETTPPPAGAPPSDDQPEEAEARATRTSLIGGTLFLLLLACFGGILWTIFQRFAPDPLHLVDPRFSDGRPAVASTDRLDDGTRSALAVRRVAPTRDDFDVAQLDAQALKLHYFATFAHREVLGFWFNLLAGSLLILFGMFVFFEAVINGEPEGESAFEFKTGGGLVLTLRSRSLGMVAVTSGAAVLLLVKQANQPTTEIVQAFFADVKAERPAEVTAARTTVAPLPAPTTAPVEAPAPAAAPVEPAAAPALLPPANLPPLPGSDDPSGRPPPDEPDED